MADHAGGYRLEFGELHEVRGEAFMLVSDLDDTMFGDDDASKAFKDFWERDARLRGACLVYNTGRALDKWLSLWREKSWCLAAPDHLITSVGTKVFKAAPDVSHLPKLVLTGHLLTETASLIASMKCTISKGSAAREGIKAVCDDSAAIQHHIHNQVYHQSSLNLDIV